jgi:hypothetical protein
MLTVKTQRPSPSRKVITLVQVYHYGTETRRKTSKQIGSTCRLRLEKTTETLNNKCKSFYQMRDARKRLIHETS